MAAAEPPRPLTPRTPRTISNQWSDIEEQIGKLTTLGSRTREMRPVPSREHEALISTIRKMLARFRSRQEQLLSVLTRQPPPMEIAFVTNEGDTDLQKFRQITQENIMMRTQIYQNQRLLAEREAEAGRLTQQIDDGNRAANSLGQNTWQAAADPSALVLVDVKLDSARQREKLQEIHRRTLEKESLLRHFQQQEVMLSSQTVSEDKSKCVELRRVRQVLEDRNAELESEVADCLTRHSAAVCERGELEQRLRFLKQSQEQIMKASAEHTSETASLRERLTQARAECQRHEQQAQREAEEISRLRSMPAPPEVIRRISSKQHPDLSERLQEASAHNDWLHAQLQQLSGGSALSGGYHAPTQDVLAPPETTPEVAIPVQTRVVEPELDSTIAILEAQMKALAAQNTALEQSFDRRSSSEQHKDAV